MSALADFLNNLNQSRNRKIATIESAVNEWLVACGESNRMVARTSVDNWFTGRSEKIGRGASEGEPLCLAVAYVLNASRRQVNILLEICGYRSLELFEATGVFPELVAPWVGQISAESDDAPSLFDDNLISISASRAVSLPPNSYLDIHMNPRFVGREETLEEIALQLNQKKGVILSGPAGIGKTQIAVEFAYRASKHFPDGIFLISFANAEMVNVEIARCGGVRGMALIQGRSDFEIEDQVALVQKEWKRPARRLLIFDNVDQVPSEDKSSLLRWVNRYVPSMGGCKVIITSRSTAWPPGTNLVPIRVKGLNRSQSIELLRSLFDRLTYKLANQLAAELGDYPLALHAAGTYLAFVGRLRDRSRDLLRQLKRDSIFKHPSMKLDDDEFIPDDYDFGVNRMFSVSFEQLNRHNAEDADGLRLLPYIALLAKGGAIPMLFLTLVTDYYQIDEIRFLRAVTRLREIGMIMESRLRAVEGSENLIHVEMHRLLCQYVTDVLDLPMNVEQVFSCGKIIAYADEAHEVAESQSQIMELAHYFMAREDRFSAEWLHQMGDFLTDRHYLELAQNCLKKVQERYESDPTIRSDVQLAMLYKSLGHNHNMAYELEDSKVYYEKSYALLSTLVDPDDARIGAVTNSLAFLAIRQCDLEAAASYLDQSIRIRRLHSADKQSLAIAHNNIAFLAHLQGKYQRALEVQLEAIEMKRNLEQPSAASIGLSYARLAATQQELGQSEAANQSISRVIESWEQDYGVNNPVIAHRLQRLARTYRNNGHVVSARFIFKTACELFAQYSGSDSPEKLACDAELAAL